MDMKLQALKLNIIGLYHSMKLDKILIFAVVIVSILSIGNVFNKAFLDFEPLQYSIFSYDKVLHLLMSIIIVRILYLVIIQIEPYYQVKRPRMTASILTLILYALIWEPFELLTFIVQNSDLDQVRHELLDVPLDWLYDISGVTLSYVLGYD